MPDATSSAYNELETVLHHIERVTAELLAALHTAHDDVEGGLSAHIMQQFIIRGELLQHAQTSARPPASDALQEDERHALSKKLDALNGMHGELGVLLNAHQGRIKSALKETGAHQSRFKGYHEYDEDRS